jgi:hypothetical protein
LETIVSNDYTPFESGDFESETTLILGARCVDGVVLIGDRKMTQTDSSGVHDVYDDDVGEKYGKIFLREWQPEMTMEELSEFDYFIIKYIEDFRLNSGVGGR